MPTRVPLAAALALSLWASRAIAADREDDPGLLLTIENGRAGVLVLRDGKTFTGSVLEVGVRRVQFALEDRSVVEVPKEIVRGIVAVRVPFGALGAPSAARVVLANGAVLGAERTERDGESLVLVSGAERRSVPSAEVRKVFQVREDRRPIRLAGRELGAPSAYLPESGEVIVSTRLLQANATAGLLGWAAVEAGSTVPGQLTQAYGANAQVSLRGGAPVLPWLRLAAGLHADLARGGHLLAASATATAGGPDAHVSLHAGPVPRGGNRLAERMGEVGVALSGTYALGRRWDVLAEGWVSRRDGASTGLALGAARLRVGRIALEAGAGRSFPDGKLFPWLAAAVDVTAW